MTVVHTKSLAARSGTKTLLAGLIGVLVGYLPQITDLITLSKPWDGIVPIVLGFVIAILKLIQDQLIDPSVSVTSLPDDISALRPGGEPVLRSEGKIVR